MIISSETYTSMHLKHSTVLLYLLYQSAYVINEKIKFVFYKLRLIALTRSGAKYFSACFSTFTALLVHTCTFPVLEMYF